MQQRMADVGVDRERFLLELHAVGALGSRPRLVRTNSGVPKGVSISCNALLAQRDQRPQLLEVEPGDDRLQRWGYAWVAQML